ncbi:hypothetical protein MGYG_03953 [Nannizzia gypsea CBS 118893]|uniref:Uncharacterized protein n=1 Tax=Arthroderma gypseum (strain ATCC MYA-4604 / CBS 118893) TaxID=535722 RepID=E4UUI4_ARTGP|nr:hypothetical protein MGYG_03953 [Nannizzia gypsea CBS 118893]EFR00951.1 hypothetical protein MGYG_03953 [Nannizzia gypsea CBS 118893]
MSDSEDYDEFMGEDYLWIDCGEPHYTDDLAMLVNPDPVFLDDGAFEAALDSDTDWEYLSDEYYDHDRPQKPRRRKEEGDSKKPTQSDTAMYYGVSWSAGPRGNNDGPLYKPGEGEKVSLLKNWREIFQESKPKTKNINEKLKHDGTIKETFRDQLSTRFRRDSENRARLNYKYNIGSGMEADGLVHTGHGPKTLLSQRGNFDSEGVPAKPAKKRHEDSQPKRASNAPEAVKVTRKFDIILPPAPKNITEYKEIVTTVAPNAPKRGRKRKAEVVAEQITHDPDPSSNPGPVTNSKRKKAGHTNGAKTATSSRPTRSSTRRK